MGGGHNYCVKYVYFLSQSIEKMTWNANDLELQFVSMYVDSAIMDLFVKPAA